MLEVSKSTSIACIEDKKKPIENTVLQVFFMVHTSSIWSKERFLPPLLRSPSVLCTFNKPMNEKNIIYNKTKEIMEETINIHPQKAFT